MSCAHGRWVLPAAEEGCLWPRISPVLFPPLGLEELDPSQGCFPLHSALGVRSFGDQTVGKLIVTHSVPLSPRDVVLGCGGRPVSDRWLSQHWERELWKVQALCHHGLWCSGHQPQEGECKSRCLCMRASLAASDRNSVLSRRGHLLACGTRKTKEVNPGSRHSGIRGLDPSLFLLLSILLPSVGFLPRQVFLT